MHANIQGGRNDRMCDRGEHPGMGWSLNDPLSSEYYKIIISDPTISTCHLIVAPYVSYFIHPNHAEVSATYGKDYPIHMCTLIPSPVNYTCPLGSSNDTFLTPYSTSTMTDSSVESLPILFLAYCALDSADQAWPVV